MNYSHLHDMNIVTLEDYVISFQTFAILSYPYKEQIFSIVHDKDGVFLLKKRPLQLVKESCRHYGWTYQQRINQTKRHFETSHKLPITIEHNFDTPCILFPLLSPKSDDNVWIGYHAIQHATLHASNLAIQLKNGSWITLKDASLSTLRSQYFNASLYERRCIYERQQSTLQKR